MENTKQYGEGFAAAKAGKKRDDNPYRVVIEGREQHNIPAIKWYAGFDDGVKPPIQPNS